MGSERVLIAVGSVAFDSIRTPFGTRDDILGGSATYFCVAASYFTDVGMITVVGDDFPEKHISFYRRKGIDLSGLEQRPGKTLRWECEYGADMNKRVTLDTSFNVFADFSPNLSSAHRSAEFIFLGSVDPDLQLSALGQLQRPKLVACDTIHHWIETRRNRLLQNLSAIDLLIVNDSEARQLAGETDLMRAAGKLRNHGLKTLVIKRGDYGAVMFNGPSVFILPAFPVEEVVDPTGAGDAFAGGMMGYLAATGSLDDSSMRKAAVFGTVMASFTVADFGPLRLGDLTFTEIDARYREFYRITRFPDISE
ncbi:MAG TPA: PfkB family carbohydrate kinase [Acidobacteriota bacterium]|nr:PfkB family carbohydrate kinase [Acidobacteriota bacterium]